MGEGQQLIGCQDEIVIFVLAWVAFGVFWVVRKLRRKDGDE